MPYRESSISHPESARQQTDAWVRATSHVLNSFVEANRAALAAFGFASDCSESDRPTATAAGPSEPDWSSERTVDSLDELGLGDTVTFTKTIEDEDVLAFARASGDTNPIHLSNAFAERTRFERRIAHGTLVSGVVSAALARLPGQVIYLSQDTQYLNPVEPGDTVTAVVEVTEVIADGRYRLSTVVTNEEDRAILEGEAVVLVDGLPDEMADSS